MKLSRDVIVSSQVFVAHLEHLVDKTTNWFGLTCTVADQNRSSVHTGVEQNDIILVFDGVQLLDDIQDLPKDVVCELFALLLEVFVTNKDLIV